MQAIVFTQYGPPNLLQFKEIPKPAPADNQVTVKIHAASANPLDWHIMRASPFFVRLITGLLKPKQDSLGSDFAGVVEAVGKGISQFRPGDAVFGAKGFAGGAFAEYVCATEEQLALKPANISFEQAAAAPVAALTALQGLRDKGQIRPGQRVLIEGASGGVGTFAVQLARFFGAEVTAVCSTRNVETARLIGADHVIDYTQQDFTKSGERYDLIFGANAYRSLLEYRRSLNPDGIFVSAGGKATFSGILEGILLPPLLSRMDGRKFRGVLTKMTKSDLLILRELLEAGSIKPVLDRTYPLSQTAEALRYLEAGHAQGKVVLTVISNE